MQVVWVSVVGISNPMPPKQEVLESKHRAIRLQLGWGSYKVCKQWAPLGTGCPCTWWRGWSRVLAMASSRRTACLLYESRCVALPSSAYKCLVLQRDKDKPSVSAGFLLKQLCLVQVKDEAWSLETTTLL